MKILLTVNQSVDTSDLLEELDSTSDEKSTTRFDLVGSEKIPPLATTDRVLECDDILDLLVLDEDVVVGLGLALESSEDRKRFVCSAMGSKPSRGFRNDEDEDENGDLEDCLNGDRDTPCNCTGDRGETVANPVGDHDTGVEKGELEADESTSSSLRTDFALKYGHSRIKESLIVSLELINVTHHTQS